MLLTCWVPARACLWDTDTLKQEAGKVPDAVDVITGRFPRNPDLYYSMRLDRVGVELKAHPDRLELYDDAGVACDRLGRDEEAIQWMRRKHQYLARLAPGSKESRDHWYRYHANLGTFLVHQWFRRGADRGLLQPVRRARAEIAQALHINPNAHFGRETFQLKAMDWIIQNGSDDFADYLKLRQSNGPNPAVTKGMLGLIALGNAWQSVDIFQALAESLTLEGHGWLAYLTRLRVCELLDTGARPLHSDVSDLSELKASAMISIPMTFTSLEKWQKKEMDNKYRRLRANADEWQQQRSDFMVAQLEKGRHPDTGAAFWDGYQEIPRLDLEITRPGEWKWTATVKYFLLILAGVSSISFLVLALGQRRQHRQRQV